MEGRQGRKEACNAIQGCIYVSSLKQCCYGYCVRKMYLHTILKMGSKMYHANLPSRKKIHAHASPLKKGDCDLRSIPKQFFFDDTKSQFSIFKKTSATFFLCYEKKKSSRTRISWHSYMVRKWINKHYTELGDR